MIAGINIHCNPFNNTDGSWKAGNLPRSIDMAASLGFKALRYNLGMVSPDTTVPDGITRANWVIGQARERGMRVTLVMQIVGGTTIADTPAAAYTKGFNAMNTALQALASLPYSIELENEVPLALGFTTFQGQTVAEYQTPLAINWAQLIKGEFDAARQYAPSAKLIVGTVNCAIAFPGVLKTAGVAFDRVSYHAYVNYGAGYNSSLRDWCYLGDMEPIFKTWGAPVTVNEVNSQVNQSTPQNALLAAAAVKAIGELRQMSVVEEIMIYELLDSTNGPDYNFGIAAFSGGNWVIKPFCQPIVSAVLN